jgi:hypothetical protein
MFARDLENAVDLVHPPAPFLNAANGPVSVPAHCANYQRRSSKKQRDHDVPF